jgi:hypothetical protein
MKATIEIVDVTAFEANYASAVSRSTDDIVRLLFGNIFSRTPTWTGGLRQRLHSESLPTSGRVWFDDGVVAHVMESSGCWTRPPPWKPLMAWVTGKLGFVGKDAARMVGGMRRNIKLYGIKLPLKVSGYGNMIERTMKALPPKFLFASWVKAFNIYSAGKGKVTLS